MAAEWVFIECFFFWVFILNVKLQVYLHLSAASGLFQGSLNIGMQATHNNKGTDPN